MCARARLFRPPPPHQRSVLSLSNKKDIRSCLSNDSLVFHLPFLFCGRGTSCRVLASYYDPRRASCLLGEVLYDRQQLPLLSFLPSGTPRRADAITGTSCSPSAKQIHNHVPRRSGLLQGALLYASHSTSALQVSAQDNLAACTGGLVLLALLPPLWHKESQQLRSAGLHHFSLSSV